MPRPLAWLAGTLLLLVPVVAGGLLLATVEPAPLVSRPATIAPQSIAEARRLLLSNDPRRLRPGEARQTAIPAALVDEAVNYLASRFLHGRGALVMAGEQAELRLSLQLPLLPTGRFVNLTARLGDNAGLPRIAAVRLGALPLPPALAEPLLDLLIGVAGYEREWQLARQAIRQTRFDGARQQLVVAYVWQPVLLERARALAVVLADLVLIRDAQQRLVALLAARPPGSRVALVDLLGPLLRDGDGAGASLARQRAALLVMAAYLAERNLAALIPEAAGWPRPRRVELTLAGRYDAAQHFVISAALAAWAGEPLADAIGSYKELADASHGYGFSFADLAADRAGTAFGERIVSRSPALAQLLAGRLADADLLPPLDGLPEYLRQREFQQRYGGPGKPAYDGLIAEIDRRLMALPVYRRNGDT